jgi:integrase
VAIGDEPSVQAANLGLAQRRRPVRKHRAAPADCARSRFSDCAEGERARDGTVDLRHSGVTWRLNSGVPPTEVAAWAGHSVEVLMRTYAKCMTGMEDVWIGRMNDTLHLQDPDRQNTQNESSDEAD